MRTRSPSGARSPSCWRRDEPLRRHRDRRRPGRPAAGRAAHRAPGMTVAVIERKLVGGTCVNTGCTPTKTMVASAQAAYAARRAADYGVLVEGTVRVDMAKVKARADTVAANSRTGLDGWLRSMERCTFIEGHARFEAPTAVRVGDDVLTAPRIFINVGGRAAVPALPGVDDVPFLDQPVDARPRPACRSTWSLSAAATSASSSPRCTGASAPRSPIVERLPRLIAREDADDLRGDPRDPRPPRASRSAPAPSASAWAARATASRCSSTARRASPRSSGPHLLLAVGRRPNTDDLGLDKAGVATDARGYVTVDDSLATNVPGHLGPGRLQRARRLHPHRLQRLRDRGRQPAGRRAPPRVATASPPTPSTSTRRSAASA